MHVIRKRLLFFKMSFLDAISTLKNGPTPTGTAKIEMKTLFKPTQSSSCDGVVNGQMCCFDANEAMKQNALHCRSAASVLNKTSVLNKRNASFDAPTNNAMQITRPYLTPGMDPLRPPSNSATHSNLGNGTVVGELPSYTLVTKIKPAAGWGIVTPAIACGPHCIQPKQKTDYVVNNYPGFLE